MLALHEVPKGMTLTEAPDFASAVAAGLAHGLAPQEALKSAFGKWIGENADTIQTYGLANFYDGPDSPKAFVNYSRLVQFLAIALADMGQKVEALETSNRDLLSLLEAHG